MTEKAKLELVDSPPDSVFDDIEALRKTATIKVSRRVVNVNVAVGKPKNNIYFRCHPDPAMSLDASVIVGSDGSDDFYFVSPVMLNHHVVLPRLRKVTIAVVYAWPGGTISLWPVPDMEETRVACWKSARVAFERSQERMSADNLEFRQARLRRRTAEGINTEPLWPGDLVLGNLLKLGFADKIINTPEHPYVLQLRGLAK